MPRQQLSVHPRTPLDDIIKKWVASVPHLRTDAAQERVSVVQEALQGYCFASILARMPFQKLVKTMEDAGLSEGDALSLELVLCDNDDVEVFPRNCDPCPGSGAASGRASSAPSRSAGLVDTITGDDQDGDGDYSARGGRRFQSLLQRNRRRVTQKDINEYNHPANFYNLPSDVRTIQDINKVLGAIYLELEAWAGDAYPNRAERMTVTDAAALAACGIGDPPPYGGKERTWDVRSSSNPQPKCMLFADFAPCPPFSSELSCYRTQQGPAEPGEVGLLA